MYKLVGVDFDEKKYSVVDTRDFVIEDLTETEFYRALNSGIHIENVTFSMREKSGWVLNLKHFIKRAGNVYVTPVHISDTTMSIESQTRGEGSGYRKYEMWYLYQRPMIFSMEMFRGDKPLVLSSDVVYYYKSYYGNLPVILCKLWYPDRKNDVFMRKTFIAYMGRVKINASKYKSDEKYYIPSEEEVKSGVFIYDGTEYDLRQFCSDKK